MDESAFRLYYGATWLNFVATRSHRRRLVQIERLTSADRLAEWLDAVDLTPERAPTDAELAAAIELREALYELSRAAVDERAPDAAAVRATDRALRHDAAPALRLVNGALTRSTPATATEALGRIARQAVEQLTGPDRVRLRACGDPTCAGVFVDETGRRRWCADSSCGVRNRVRAHRERIREDH